MSTCLSSFLEMSENLKNIWKNVTPDVPEGTREFWLELIYQKYSESGRDCHNLIYLEEKFKELENFKDHIKNRKAFTFALFFQYLEYSPKNPECYKKNIQSFSEFAKDANISTDSELFVEVNKLLEASAIYSTEEHKEVGAYGNDDLHYFLDLDMFILGSSEKKYNQYVKNIQSEYSFLDPAAFNNLRKKVLQSFLLIPNIFATKEFRDKFDAQARKNIQNELNER